MKTYVGEYKTKRPDLKLIREHADAAFNSFFDTSEASDEVSELLDYTEELERVLEGISKHYIYPEDEIAERMDALVDQIPKSCTVEAPLLECDLNEI